jgi:hypothetical protein
MEVRQIGDWMLEDRLAAGGPPVVVLFLKSEGRKERFRRTDFRRVASDHPHANFYEVDLIENPSVRRKYGLPAHPVVLIFVNGVEVTRHGGPFLASTVARVLGPCHHEEDQP